MLAAATAVNAAGTAGTMGAVGVIGGGIGGVGGNVGGTVLRGGVSGQMFLRANDKASRVLVAAAQRRDRRTNQEGAASAGVDDSPVFERGEIEQGMPDVKGCPLPDTYASSCWVGTPSIPFTRTRKKHRVRMMKSLRSPNSQSTSSSF